MISGCDFDKVVDMCSNVVYMFNVLKRVLWCVYYGLEPMYAAKTDFLTPNEEYENLKNQ